MALPWWQHHKHCCAYYYYYFIIIIIVIHQAATLQCLGVLWAHLVDAAMALRPNAVNVVVSRLHQYVGSLRVLSCLCFRCCRSSDDQPTTCSCQFVYLTFLCKGKGKGEGLDTCYSATYMSQTHDQQCFTISEADWHEPVLPQHNMWPSIARANGQLDPWCR